LIRGTTLLVARAGAPQHRRSLADPLPRSRLAGDIDARRDGTDAHPAILCPRCGERVPLREGRGSAGAKVFTCPACGHEFTGQEGDAADDDDD
jgi:predicted RNA-binding Zn-ribbon protein involved in translation (DUF1610 family)